MESSSFRASPTRRHRFIWICYWSQETAGVIKHLVAINDGTEGNKPAVCFACCWNRGRRRATHKFAEMMIPSRKLCSIYRGGNESRGKMRMTVAFSLWEPILLLESPSAIEMRLRLWAIRNVSWSVAVMLCAVSRLIQFVRIGSACMFSCGRKKEAILLGFWLKQHSFFPGIFVWLLRKYNCRNRQQNVLDSQWYLSHPDDCGTWKKKQILG